LIKCSLYMNAEVSTIYGLSSVDILPYIV